MVRFQCQTITFLPELQPQMLGRSAKSNEKGLQYTD